MFEELLIEGIKYNKNNRLMLSAQLFFYSFML